MPEGDSIRRIAARVAPRLVGKTLERVTTQGLERDVAGQTVVSVEPHGKHLVIELSDGTHVRAHLGMNGRQRSYSRAEGERLLARMSPGRVSLALWAADTIELWINAPTIEIAKRRAPRHGQAIAPLAPDVLAEDFDPEIAADRAAEHSTRAIADVLLDQRVTAGIGNIWKCESLFACGVDPRRIVSTIDRATLIAIYSAARDLMRASVNARRPQDFAVYSRTGKPCPRCATPIDCYQLGSTPRWTWSCARCQVPSGASAGASR